MEEAHIPTALSLQIHSEFPSCSIGQQEATLMVSLKGTPYETAQRNSRAPVDIVAVIDRSSSMKDKMKLVQDTLLFMVQQLKESDRLGLVVYDQNVDTLLPLSNMNSTGKDMARYAIQKITIGGQTNCSGGLLQGLDMLRRRKAGSDVCSVLLFTDGLANLGITKPEQIKRAIKGVLGQIASICSVFTLGYGDEPDPEYLREISEEGNGLFYQIEEANDIPLAFADCLGGLLSVVAQRVVLRIEAPKHVIITNCQTAYKQTVVETGKVIDIEIDDIYSDERKDMLCTVAIDSVDEIFINWPVLDASVGYLNVLEKKTEYLTASCTINRIQEVTIQVANQDVDQQRNRFLCIQAMEHALHRSKAERFEEAQQHLTVAKQRIMSSSCATSPYSMSLVSQLDEVHRDLNDKKQFQTRGRSTLSSYNMSHQQQRSTHRAATSSYSTTSKSYHQYSYTSK